MIPQVSEERLSGEMIIESKALEYRFSPALNFLCSTGAKTCIFLGLNLLIYSILWREMGAFRLGPLTN